MLVTSKIRAALFSAGLISSLSASDADCQAAVLSTVGHGASQMSERSVIMAIMSGMQAPHLAGVGATAGESYGGGYDPGPHISGSGRQRFAVDALAALSARCGLPTESSSADTQLTHAPLSVIARRCLELSGHHVDQFGASSEQIALQAMQMAGRDVMMSGTGLPQLSGDFPNLLSALAGKILDQAIAVAPPTYPIWTAKLPDVTDFKPHNILGISPLDELDQVNEDRVFDSVKFDEELSGFIQVGRYGNRFGLNPVMVANDDLDAFAQGLQSLAMAHETTLNRLCLTLIGANVELLDGYSLFDDAYHGNDVEAGSGGAPSTTQAALMKSKHRTQTGIMGKGKVRTGPKIALVPTALEEAAMQTFLKFSQLAESKLAVTDATINVYRGTIEPVVEPDLDDYSSAIWYTFADPRIRRCIVHVFQRGFGRGGKRSRWFDPATKVMYFDLEGRFAAAAAGHRGAIRNAGV